MLQNKLKNETIEFLKEYVFKKSPFNYVSDENAEDVIDFILLNYVTPLVHDKEEAHVPIDEKLLKRAEAAIDDISES